MVAHHPGADPRSLPAPGRVDPGHRRGPARAADGARPPDAAAGRAGQRRGLRAVPARQQDGRRLVAVAGGARFVRARGRARPGLCAGVGAAGSHAARHREVQRRRPVAPPEFARAERAFERALALNPDLATAHYLYAHLEAETGRARDAMVRLLTRARSRRSDPELFAGLVTTCRYCGLLDESIAAYEQVRASIRRRARASPTRTTCAATTRA